MNIVLFGYYGFEDGYYAYGQYFKDYFATVSFFPLIECRDLYKINKTTINDIETVISGKPLPNIYSHKLINHNCAKNIVIIAHNNDMLANLKISNLSVIEYIVSLKKKYNFQLLQINWDPIIDNKHNHIINYFDKSYCSDPSLLKFYKNVKFFYTGFSPSTSYYKKDDAYKCDVSFIGTNLYVDPSFPNQKLNRKIILDKIYADKTIKLHIYGPLFLKQLYPDSYKGQIPYKDCYKVFSNSTINLNISPLNNVNTDNKIYYSERLPQILGCNRIMLSNNDLTPLLIPGEDYIYIKHIDELIPSIKNMLNSEFAQLKMITECSNKKKIFNYENIMKTFCAEIKQF